MAKSKTRNKSGEQDDGKSIDGDDGYRGKKNSAKVKRSQQKLAKSISSNLKQKNIKSANPARTETESSLVPASSSLSSLKGCRPIGGKILSKSKLKIIMQDSTLKMSAKDIESQQLLMLQHRRISSPGINEISKKSPTIKTQVSDSVVNKKVKGRGKRNAKRAVKMRKARNIRKMKHQHFVVPSAFRTRAEMFQCRQTYSPYHWMIDEDEPKTEERIRFEEPPPYIEEESRSVIGRSLSYQQRVRPIKSPPLPAPVPPAAIVDVSSIIDIPSLSDEETEDTSKDKKRESTITIDGMRKEFEQIFVNNIFNGNRMWDGFGGPDDDIIS